MDQHGAQRFLDQAQQRLEEALAIRSHSRRDLEHQRELMQETHRRICWARHALDGQPPGEPDPLHDRATEAGRR